MFFLCLGEFAIRPDKKSPPVIRKVKKVGMIAGGTGMIFSYYFICCISKTEDLCYVCFIVFICLPKVLNACSILVT